MPDNPFTAKLAAIGGAEASANPFTAKLQAMDGGAPQQDMSWRDVGAGSGAELHPLREAHGSRPVGRGIRSGRHAIQPRQRRIGRRAKADPRRAVEGAVCGRRGAVLQGALWRHGECQEDDGRGSRGLHGGPVERADAWRRRCGRSRPGRREGCHRGREGCGRCRNGRTRGRSRWTANTHHWRRGSTALAWRPMPQWQRRPDGLRAPRWFPTTPRRRWPRRPWRPVPVPAQERRQARQRARQLHRQPQRGREWRSRSGRQ